MEKRSYILGTAQTLFAQFGLKKVTVDDIARQARVSKATVYKYFANKSEIFDVVVKSEADQLLEAVEAAVATQRRAIDKLRAHLLTRLKEVQVFVNFFRVTQESWGDYWPSIAGIRKQFMTRDRNIVKRILDEGVISGELTCENTELAAHALAVSLASVEYQWTTDELEIPIEDLIDTMVNMMSEGIRRRP